MPLPQTGESENHPRHPLTAAPGGVYNPAPAAQRRPGSGQLRSSQKIARTFLRFRDFDFRKQKIRPRFLESGFFLFLFSRSPPQCQRLCSCLPVGGARPRCRMPP